MYFPTYDFTWVLQLCQTISVLIVLTFVSSKLALMIVKGVFYYRPFYERVRQSSRRKMAIAMWSQPDNCQVTGSGTIDVTKALELCADLNLSITHMMIKAAAIALRRCPFYNTRIAFDRIVPLKEFHVSCLVNNGKDLEMVRIKDGDKQSLQEIKSYVDAKVAAIRSKRDSNAKKHKRAASFLPPTLMRLMLIVGSLLTEDIGITAGLSKILGYKKHLFGGMLLSNVGALPAGGHRIETAIVPLVPFSGVPVVMAAGAVMKSPMAVEVDGVYQVAVRDVMSLSFTGDHRYGDGNALTKLGFIVLYLLEHPELLLSEEDPFIPLARPEGRKGTEISKSSPQVDVANLDPGYPLKKAIKGDLSKRRSKDEDLKRRTSKDEDLKQRRSKEEVVIPIDAIEIGMH